MRGAVSLNYSWRFSACSRSAHEYCGRNGLAVRGTEGLATADEVQRSLLVFSQRFRPTDFYEIDRTLDRPIVRLNFQKLTFGRSDAEQESHSGRTIVHRRAMPLFEDRAIAIHRALQAIGAGTNPRPSCFSPTFRPRRPSSLPCGFMTRVLRNLQAHFPQQCLDV